MTQAPGWCSLLLPNPLILIVDDEEVYTKLLGQMLKAGGAEVITARDGHSGLVAAKAHDPDLIISDLKMPFLGGEAMLAELRSQGNRRPVIFLTGGGEIADVVQALRHDAFDFLNKPVSKDHFMTVVQKALRMEHQRLMQEAVIDEACMIITKLAETFGEKSEEVWRKEMMENAVERVKNRRLTPSNA